MRQNVAMCGNGSKTLKRKNSESIVRKGENAGNQHFLLFPQCFLPYQKSSYDPQLFCRLQMLSIWFSPKFGRLAMKFVFGRKKKKTRCACETPIPPQRPFLSKTVTLIFDLDLDR